MVWFAATVRNPARAWAHIAQISDFCWKSDHKNSKKWQKMSYRRKISRWVRIWHQNHRSSPHSWVIRKRPVKNQLWLGPDSGDLVPIRSQLRTHHEILTVRIETLVLNSHSGGEMSHSLWEVVNLTFFFLRIREWRIWLFFLSLSNRLYLSAWVYDASS